ncbi:MAG: class I SAM-dependent methyltransferase [Deltaproteobacteria bacterium]|nr:class I SAM-dependent methyltransferase [Deltaproteobacteria bacterium]
MDDAIIQKIKKIVSGNFDKSFDHYQAFEERHHFFADLTLRLAAACGLEKGARVLDIGCGNGASAEVLSRELACRVVGLDLSAKMIENGRQRIKDPRIRLEVGDAVDPQSAIAGEELNFDAALYNAAIFIIPDAAKSMLAASACLKPGGALGFSFYPQILSAAGEDLFAIAFDRCNFPRPKAQVITSYEKALAGLRQCCRKVTETAWERPFSETFLIDFFSIPAQSASLFPQLDYEERRRRAPELFTALQPEAESARIVWRLAAGKV